MAQPTGRREQQKQARRAALLKAARSALERGDFSMRRLAEEAGMAEVTPYNLFGSKRGVLEALYAVLRSESEQRLMAAGQPDPLMRLFDAIDLLAEDLATAPGFHRALFSALFERSAAPTLAPRQDAGVAYWEALVAAAAAAGRLRPDARHDLLARAFVYLLGGAMLDWLEDRITPEEWRAVTAHGLALLALPLTVDEAVPVLLERLTAAEAALPSAKSHPGRSAAERPDP